MTRAKKQATNKEDIKHALEDLWGLTPEDMDYEIFAIEHRLGVDDFLVLCKDETHDLLHKTYDCDAARLTSVDAGIIRLILHYKRHLLEKDFHPDGKSFRLTSISMNGHAMFRKHPDNLTILSQAVDGEASTPRSLMPQLNQHVN